MTFEEHLSNLRRQLDDAKANVLSLESQIDGMLNAKQLLSPPSGNGTGPPARRKRRDIRGEVKAFLTEFGDETNVAYIAERIGCRKSQVEAALAAIRASKL